MKNQKLIKNKCEIDGCIVSDPEVLELHHIIERTDINTSDHPNNLAILCANHHAYLHCGLLKIIGVFPSTKLPNKRVLVYELNGKKNIDIDEPYFNYEPPKYKI